MLINYKYVTEYIKSPKYIFSNLRLWLFGSKNYTGEFVFVMGPPRSGTTLMESLITAHSKFKGWGHETSVFSPKNVINKNRFFYLSDEEFSLCRKKKSIVDFFVCLHARFIDENLVPVEKTPQHAKRLKFILNSFPNAKIVFMVRDPRDAFYSGYRGGNIPQCKSAANYCKYWEKCILPLLSTKSERVRVVKYEDLVNNPKKVMTHVMSHLSNVVEIGQLDSENRTSNPRINEGVAFKKLSSDIDSKSVGRYIEMDESTLNKFSRISKYINKFNYS